jgi:hypothetical protein
MKRRLFYATGISIPEMILRGNALNENKLLSIKKVLLKLFIIVLFILCGAEAKAAIKTWNGSTGTTLDWTLSTNWVGGIAPVAGDDIVFNTSGTLTFTTMPAASIAYNSITVSQGDVTLTGATTITITLGGNSGTDLSVSSGASLTLGTSINITLGAGASADISGSFTIGSGDTFIAGGDGATVSISGTLTNNGTYNASSTNAVTTVSGTLINTGAFSNTSTSRLVFSAGSTYRHARDGGPIPDATWASTSTCYVSGITGNAPQISSATQPFGNFTWDCTSQSGFIDLKGTLTSVDGNFTVTTTNGRGLQLSTSVSCNLRVKGNASLASGPFGIGATTLENTMTVDGDFTFSSGVLYISPQGGNSTLNVGGNFSSSGTLYFTFAGYPATATINVTGNASVTGGTFNMSSTSSTGTLNVGGDFSFSGGSITETSTGSGSIIFNGTGTQVYTTGGTLSNTINFAVNNGSTLQMGTGASPSIISGSNGSFTLASGATLGVTSTSGISRSGATGNIQVTGTRTYSTGANYIYNGSSAQTTGDGLMQNSPAKLTIDNTTGVTLSETTTLSGLLTMNNGTLNTANTSLTIGSLTGSGNITNSSGSAANVTITIGSDGTSPAAYSGTIGNGTATSVSLAKTGTGTLILSGTNTYTGTTTISGGTIQSGAANCLSSSSAFIMNGGTFNTGSTTGFNQSSGTLTLQAGSEILFGTGTHTLAFTASNGQTWGSSATLTIKGWTGTAGSGGTAGQLFVGTDANGLTADQLSKITFYGYNAGATILSTGELCPTSAPNLAVSSSDPAVSAGNILQLSQNNVIYLFDNTASFGDAVISGLQITTAGSYTGTDISNIKAWYSSDATFNSSSDVLLSTINSSLGPGTHIFPSWRNQSIGMGTTGYIFITTDVTCPSTPGANLNVNAVTQTDLSLIAGNVTATAFNGGIQTIKEATPANAISPAATTGVTESILSWTNPAGCYNEIMIVARAGAAVTALPSGDGSDYSASLTFGSGTGYDGGYVVYKGIVSPQTVTNLATGVTYYYTFFTRDGVTWSDGVTINAKTIASSSLNYRSYKTGNWSDASTWEVYDGSAWGPASTAPTSANNTINILNGHTVTINQAVSADQVTVETGGKVTVSNVTLTIANGAGNDFTVDGTLELTGSSGTIVTTGTLVFDAGGTYIHNRDKGVIPSATWNISSTCVITGMLATDYADVTASSSYNQTFGNFTWNCPSQTAEIGLYGNLRTVKGNFTVISTGTSDFSLGGSTAGDLTVDGNYTQTGGILSITRGLSTRAMTVKGNITISGGTLYLSSAGSSYTGTINAAGNFTFTGGTITEITAVNPGGIIVFNGSSVTQTYTSGGTVNYTVNFTVNSGAYLQMAAAGTTISGAGTFTLSSGAKLGITSPNGITAEVATMTGNIQTTTGRTFYAGANYTYNGTGSQYTGTGLPTSALKGTLEIASGAVVTSTNEITSDATVSVDGTLIPGAATQVMSGTGTLTGTGTVRVSRTAPVADFSSQYTIANKVLTGLTVEYSELSGSQVISPLTYYNLKLDNTSGTNTLTGTASVTGTLTTTAGGTFDVGVNQLTVGTLLNNGSITINSSDVTTNGSMTVASASGTGTATYTRFMPADALWHYVSSPVNTSSPAGSFYAWNEPAGDWDASPINTSTSPLASGKGYTLVGGSTGSASVSYTGAVVTSASQPGTAPYTNAASYLNDRGTWGGGGWNLLGNPFTSAMDATAFITVNGNTGNKSLDPNYNAVYIYDGDIFTYIGQEVSGYPNASGKFSSNNVQAGQGFFVLADSNNVSFSFTSAMQVHDQSVPMTKKAGKPKKAWPGLQLKVKKDNLSDMTMVVYNQAMTHGLDPGYDIGLYSSGTDLTVYTVLSQDNGKNFTRQALPLPEGDTITTAVGLDTWNGGFVTFSAYVVPMVNYTYYLEDRLTGIYTDLRAGTYTAQVPADTYGTGRFYLKAIRTGNSQRRSPADNPNLNEVRIWKSGTRVIIQGTLGSNATAEMYDMQARMILKNRLTGSSLNTIDLPSDAGGVYIVIVRDGSKVYRQKIVVL